jgi:hypothetical protein
MTDPTPAPPPAAAASEAGNMYAKAGMERSRSGASPGSGC